MRMFSLGIPLVLAAWAIPSLACHRISPDRAPVDSYEAVFLGRVTGIHLVGYENEITGKPDGTVDGMEFNITDGSAPVVVNVVPLRMHHGKLDRSIELSLVGCTAPLPGLRERGLFFINPKTDSAVTVWESDADNFSRWLKRLGLSGDEA